MNKYIYHFGLDSKSLESSNPDLLGGKGAGLAEMSNLGINVPPGFTISTEICRHYYAHNKLPSDFDLELKKALHDLESKTGKIFGDNKNPLLLSVRSGAKISMPGMMDTFLNLGMNEELVEILASKTNNLHFALDTYRRFLSIYSSVVLDLPGYLFEDILETIKSEANISEDHKISSELLKKVIENFNKIIKQKSDFLIPTNPYEQLKAAIIAVLKSWKSERAVIYRKINNIDDDLGTAINVQSMAFGNMGEDSATGIVFTRSPSNGEKKLFGEFLINAQGEDVVAGIRTPFPIDGDHKQSMQNLMPKMFNELEIICEKLEKHYKNPQDIEFTIENEQLYILQTRNAKMTALATIKSSVDMVSEGLITKEEAIMKIEPESLSQLLHVGIDYTKNPASIAKGLPASPGAACGIAVFSPYDAEELSRHHKIILVRHDTSPEDIQGMHISAGILTARGGMTSHAAVVARGMGKPCICGTSSIIVNEADKSMRIGDLIIKQGDVITIDGSEGNIFLGEVALIQPQFSKDFARILEWSNELGAMEVRTNAETPLDAKTALKFGASGIGLCRTEHMFFDQDKLPLVREMIVAPDQKRKQIAIDKLLPLQIRDFKELFRIMNGKSVNIRLLDPPLHEFLPIHEEDKIALSKSLDMPLSAINYRLKALHEVNPMLGHRGCRLGISFPEIYKMQVQAIFTAREELKSQENIESSLELMIPLVSNINELKILKKYIYEICEKGSFKLGTMIELPRAAIISKEIAMEVNYFSFGTNDLTQTTYGISRDDIASFLPDYLEKKIFNHDPFLQIDEEAVGELMKLAIKNGKEGNANIKFGACGEHSGNPKSIEFFHKIGIDYISCSPYRIPTARIAAAQAKIKLSNYGKLI